MRFLFFGCRHTWEYKYLGFTSSALSAPLRLLSKRILRILTTQWNQGLVAILILGVKRMRYQTKKRGNEMLRRWVMQ
uniref:Uncharacterized protein n=1 Tax=Arundo donax TaxID=35708 RepID=A0A0A9DSW9_ARUDO